METTTLLMTMRRIVWLIVGCSAFVLLSIPLILSNELASIVGGVLCIVFFGIGGAFAITRFLRNRLILELSATGIRLGNGRSIAWPSITAVGIGEVGTVKLLGIQLTPEAGAEGGYQALRNWSRERSGGWDLSWSGQLFDRPLPEVVALIERYRGSVPDAGLGTAPATGETRP